MSSPEGAPAGPATPGTGVPPLETTGSPPVVSWGCRGSAAGPHAPVRTGRRRPGHRHSRVRREPGAAAERPGVGVHGTRPRRGAHRRRALPARPDDPRPAAPDGRTRPRRGPHGALGGGARRPDGAACAPSAGSPRCCAAPRRIVIGDPFSRYVQLLLTLTRAARPGRRRRRHRHHGVHLPTRPRRTAGALAPQRRRPRRAGPGLRAGLGHRPRAGSPRSPRAAGAPSSLFSSMPVEAPPGVDGHRQRLRLDPRPLRPAPAHPRRRHRRHLAGGDRRRGRRPLSGGGRARWPVRTAPPATSRTAARAPRSCAGWRRRRGWRSSGPTCRWN